MLGGLLMDIEQGYTTRLAVVVPPGPGWPLPAYELALLITGEARGMGVDLETTLVYAGARAAGRVRAARGRGGVRRARRSRIAIETAAYADVAPGRPATVVMHPGGRRLRHASRGAAAARGRRIDGVPADPDGFVEVDEHCRVRGLPGVWAAGDGIAFPIKFGGLATQQADAAAEDIAMHAGAILVPRPFRPVLRGRLLTGVAARALAALRRRRGRRRRPGRRARAVVAARQGRRALPGAVAGRPRRRGDRRPSPALGGVPCRPTCTASSPPPERRRRCGAPARDEPRPSAFTDS